jgi:hypothetical protein
MALEAKSGEPFDETVETWLANAKPRSRKPARLAQLCEVLRVTEQDSMECRYQLMHRPVAAILEANRFHLTTALFVVQAFGANDESFTDYERWAKLLGVMACAGVLHQAGQFGGISLWIAWVSMPTASDATVRAAV